ncbi:tetraspanin-8-like isoform X1 [Simochromis diagramma]|uniref:tetraspanin-8-like isoform X1 n=1 Tax=Simochromis diagramma TaxID=43689 RepID=UPI001A7E763F|nr:tetraspanin-8-like isoform X1 [Simochromis diagramma]XP_039891936.1 tetraspanin-8-like isoform X1 [Simochromis diagramma]
MAQINICLKRIFTVFNIFFMVVGGVAIVLALWCQFFMNIRGGYNLEGRATKLFILFIVGCITIMITMLGAYGAHKENKVALITSLVYTVIGCWLMLITGIQAAIIHPQLRGIGVETFSELVPLDKSSTYVRNMTEDIQKQFHCCGLFSYKDWENIPDSCVCSQEEEKEGKCQTVKNNTFMLQRKSVYTKTCFPTIMDHIQFHYNIILVVSFTLAILALLGVILSSIMVYHLYRFNSHTMMILTRPPKYNEMCKPPPY